MTDGLITRIGKWADRKWAAKATWLDVQEQETRCSDRHSGVLNAIGAMRAEINIIFQQIQKLELTQIPDVKDVADLKTRIEKMELYSGMTRKVDPTKPPVAKSAFSM